MDSIKMVVLQELEKAHGVVTVACNNAGIARSTFYDWKADEEFAKAVEDISEAAIDHVESKLFKLIDKEDTAATIFFMKTRGKKRGYIERTELSGPDGDPITLAFEKVPSFVREIETKQNGIKESPRGIMTKGGFIPQ